MASIPGPLRPLVSLTDRLAIIAIVGAAHAAVLAGSIGVTPVEQEPGLREIGVVTSEEIAIDEPEPAREVPSTLPEEMPAEQPQSITQPVESKPVEIPETLTGADRQLAKAEPEPKPVEEKKEEPVEEAKAADAQPDEQASRPAVDRPKPAASREMLVQYAVLAAAAINRMKFYPGDARNRGNTGIVEVAFVIDAAGVVIEKRVSKSSGSKVLDEAALRMVAIAELPPPPNGRFRGRITINFKIRK